MTYIFELLALFDLRKIPYQRKIGNLWSCFFDTYSFEKSLKVRK